MSKFGIVQEFWSFRPVRKKREITLILLFLVVLGAWLVFAPGSAPGPFMDRRF